MTPNIADPTNEFYTTRQQSRVTARPRRGVVLHHGATTDMDAILSMEINGTRQVSSNRVVKDLRCARVVSDDPDIRAWSLSSPYWDSVLSSCECANESTAGWTISPESHETIAQWVAFKAQTEGWWPSRSGAPSTWTVFGHREIYMYFGDSYATACPGGMDLDWITARAQQLLTAVLLTPNGDTMLYITTAAAGGKPARYALIDPVNIPGGSTVTEVYADALDMSRVATTGNPTGAPLVRSAAEFDATVKAAARWAKLWQSTGSGNGPTLAQIVAAVDAADDDEHAAIGAAIAAAAKAGGTPAEIAVAVGAELAKRLTS